MTSHDPIRTLIHAFARLPGIGEKTAARLTFHLLRGDPEEARGLARALNELAERVRLCSRCCMPTQADPCSFCTDTRRDDRVICVVEKPQDVLAIDRTGEFRGRYHVLHGTISPLEGRGPDDLHVRELMARLSAGERAGEGGGGGESAQEVILALSPTVEGDATALYLTRLLRPSGIVVTRIAQGLPMGSDLEYADRMTLARALETRRPA